MNQWIRVFTPFLAIVSVVCCVSATWAAAPVVLVDSDGFESPTFATGSVAGQNGWASASSGSASATVEAGPDALDGAQSLHVVRGAGSTGFWAVNGLGAPGGGSNIIQIQWDMTYDLLEQANHPNSFGPFFGVQAYDDLTVGGSVLDIGALGVDSTTRDVLVTDGASGAFQETGFQVTHDEVHSYNMVLNFNDSTYTAFVDGVPVAKETFVSNPGGTAGVLTDADIVARAAAGDVTSQGLVNEALFDNFTVTQGIAADFDDDGDVDGDDESIWEGAFLGGTAAGDANGDGVSDGSDFLIWQEQFGIDLTVAPAVAAASAVPEPAAIGLAAFAVLGLGLRASKLRRAA